MALKVHWSKEASEQLNTLYDYLEASWEEQVIRAFSRQLESKIKLITEQPHLFKSSHRLEGTRECIVSKHNTIFYTYDKSHLYIVSFWDNRQDPSSL